MRTAKEYKKRVLAILLSAALLADPAADTMIVYAAEQDEDLNEQDTPQEGGTEQTVSDNTVPDAETTGEQGSEAESEEREPEPTVSGNASEEEEPSISENALEEAEGSKEGDDGLFSEMPNDYVLSSEQKAMKSMLSASMGQFEESQEGTAYVERQVFAFADTRQEAEDIAHAYCAQLLEYDEGVAVLKLTEGASVGAALMTASDMENNLPAVYPDYYRYAYGEEVLRDSAALTVVEEEYETADSVSDVSVFAEDGMEPEVYAAAARAAGEPNMSYDSPYYQWQHANVGTEYARYTVGENRGQYIKIAVLDTGITASDADGLRCYIQTNKTSTTNPDWSDQDGHGTHVAGVIAAQIDGKGGAGIAPKAEIVNVKVLSQARVGKDSDIIQGIRYAIDQRVNIINMSLGGIGYNPAMEKAIDEAYHSGIAVFAAAGDDGGNNMVYPAALEHVICVAATDKNNRRASFSNYGSWVDISAPGTDIWSTGIDASLHDGYAVMSGTSQAAAVASGEAAVILSAKEMKHISEAANGEKVEALKKVMQDSAVSAGAGMGSGITSLTKAFGLTAAAEKPKAPTIECIDTSDDTAQSLKIKIDAQRDMRIFYTTNGKNPVYKNGEAGAGTTETIYRTSFAVSGDTAARGTVKAMAVSSSGAVSPVKTVSWTLKPYVNRIDISGPARVEKKKSIQLKAVVMPAYATKKAVKWTLLTADGKLVDETKIRIDPQKGKITATGQATAGNYKVIVTAQDNPDVSKAARAEYPIEVIEPNTTIQQIMFQDKPLKPMRKVLWLKQMNENQTQWDEVSLFDYVAAKEKDASAKAGAPLKEITDREALKGRLQWTSSKPAVASVDSAGKVTGKKPGTAVITVKADDNLGKKATITITVKSAVTKIAITSEKDKGTTTGDALVVARGKSIVLKAELFPAKPTNKKVNWSIAPGPDNNAAAEDMQNISVNKASGKVTVKAGAKPGNYTVTAEAADGQGAKGKKTITVAAGAISGIVLQQRADRNVTLYTQNVSEEKSNREEVTVWIKGVKGECDPEAYVVTNSNDSVVRLGFTYSPVQKEGVVARLQLQFTADGRRYGKAAIVVASTDGSNQKVTITVTVKGGITKAAFTDTPGGSKKTGSLKLFRNGTTAPNTAVLYANITGSEGANTQAYNVTSSNPQIVKVKNVEKATGKITLETGWNAVGKAAVTLAATDGSKKKAVCTVTVANPVSGVHIAPKGNNRNYAAKGKTLQLQATLECEYGAVSSKKVAWGIAENTNKTVTISGSGKISVKKNAAVKQVTVTATACDGSNAQAKYTVYITDPVKGIGFLGKDGQKMNTKTCQTVNLITQTADQNINDKNKLGGYYLYDLVWEGADTISGGVVVSSSNPKVMSASVIRKDDGTPQVALSADSEGKATITIKAMDGGGSQVRYQFKVVK